MFCLNRHFVALILSFSLVGILFAGPLEDYEDFMKKRYDLFDFPESNDQIAVPNADLAPTALDDFLKIKFSKDFQFKLNDSFFSDATTVGDSLNRLKVFLSKNKQWIKIWYKGDFRFATSDEITKNEKLSVPTKALNDDMFKAYCQAAGYSVDPRTGEIKPCQINFKPLLDILAEKLPGKIEFKRKKALEGINRSLAVAATLGVASAPPAGNPVVTLPPSESDKKREAAIKARLKKFDKKYIDEPKAPDPLKVDPLKLKSSNLIFKIGLPIGAVAFLLVGFSDKIKEYFSKKSLNKSKKLKQKTRSDSGKLKYSALWPLWPVYAGQFSFLQDKKSKSKQKKKNLDGNFVPPKPFFFFN